MSKKSIKPVSLAVGTAFVTSLAANPLATDTNTTNPFAMHELSGGYMQIADAGGTAKPGSDNQQSADKKPQKEGKCGEGKCGGKMKKEMESKGGENKSDKEDTKK